MARRVKLPNQNGDFQPKDESESFSFSLPDFANLSSESHPAPEGNEDHEFESLSLPENLVDLESLSKEIALAAQESAQDISLDLDFPSNESLKGADGGIDLSSQENAQLGNQVVSSDKSAGYNPSDYNHKEIFHSSPLSDEDIFGDNVLFDQDSFSEQRGNAHLRPANDDVTGFTHPLSDKNFAEKLYRNTALLSAAWGGGGILTTALLWPSHLSFSSLLSSSFGWASLLGISLPIAMFWGGARLIKGAKEELQHVAHNVVQRAISSHAKTAKEAEAEAITNNVRQEVLAMGRVIERTLARGAELEALVHGEVQNLERAYGENERRIHKLISELSGEREAILEHADRINTSLYNTRAAVSTELGGLTEDIARNVTNIAKTLSETLEEKSNAIFLNLKHATDNIALEFLAKMQATSDDHVNNNRDLINLLSQQFDEVQDNFRQKSSAFFNDFQLQLSHSEDMANKIGTQFYEAADRINENFDQIFNKIDSSIDEQGQRTLTAFDKKLAYFDEQAASVLTTLEDKFSRFDDAIIDRGEQTLALFDQRAENFNNKTLTLANNFDKAAGETITLFEKRAEEVEHLLQSQQQALSMSFSQTNQNLEENTNKLISVLNERSSFINENLKEHTENLANLFSFSQNNFVELMNTIKDRLQGEIEKTEASIEQIFLDRADDLENRLLQSRTYLSQIVQQETSQISDILQNNIQALSMHIASIEQQLSGSMTGLDNHVKTLETSASNITGTLSASFDVVQKALEQHSDNINTRVDALRDSLSINSFELNKTLADQTLLLEERVDRIRSLIDNGGTEFTDLIEKQYSSFKGVISNSTNQLTGSFSEYLNLLTNQVNEIRTAVSESDRLRAQLETRMETLGSAFNGQFALLDQTASRMEQSLNIGVEAVRNNLEQSALALASSLRERIAEAAQIFSIEAQKAETIVDSLGNKLNHTVYQFENELSNVQKQLTHSTNYISENVKDKLSEINSYVIGQAENAGQKLKQAGDYVASCLSRTEEQLNSSLTQFSNQIEEKMKPVRAGFANQDGAAQTKGFPSKASFSSNNASLPFGKTTSSQIASLLEVLNNHSIILNHALNLFHNLPRNFGETLQERENALTMFEKGLDQKNHETQKALREIHDLITQNFQQPRYQDPTKLHLFEQSIREYQQSVANCKVIISNILSQIRHESYHYGAHAQFISEDITRLSRDIQNGLYAQNQALKNVTHKVEALLNDSVGLESERQMSTNRHKSPSWVSNLLARANQEESPSYPAYSEAHTYPNLDNHFSTGEALSSDRGQKRTLQAMSQDIIRAIDHNYLSQLWTNYRPGEHNIDPLRLYNASGLRVFEEVKRNYYADLNFRQSVNRYIDDFERAINEVGRQHNKQGYQMRDYLISDTGKIYTMLAHIANRIQ